jgi:preprotein translocase subunit SecA
MSEGAIVLPTWDGSATAPYAERHDREPIWLDRVLGTLYGQARPHLGLDRRVLDRIWPAVESAAAPLATETDANLRAAALALHGELVGRTLSLARVARVFALVRELSARILGLRHFPVQILGGYAMLRGMLAEMEAGEGKSLTATLPAVAVALCGRPVHVITVNDYLADRDANFMRPLYAAFGLSVGLVRQGQSPAERRAAYACDLTYCTGKDLVFDYLRDRIALGASKGRTRMLVNRLLDDAAGGSPLLLRGLHFAIVDEADSVLIDEARTPLIIAGERPGAKSDEFHRQALALTAELRSGEHYRLSPAEHAVRLTSRGRDALEQATRGLDGLWTHRRAREEACEQALAARLFYHRDQQYIVKDGKVEIVDEFTGRVLADRSWERGLHQLIEVKEGCEITGERQTIARITYQRFFRRFLLLAGMTGTAREVAGELWAIYGLKVVRLPTNRPLRRKGHGLRLYPTQEARWQAVVQTVDRMSTVGGRPVLVGTRSVVASEELSRRLDAAGIAHEVLSARQDRDEAEKIARAGEAGRVTVATNMAGRGTDIRLAPGVAERGGLHVILTEFHESARIDRQLYGRAARQGDPGSYEAIVSADDEIFRLHAPRFGRAAAARSDGEGAAPAWVARMLQHAAQRHAERRNSRIRRENVRQDRELDRRLAFSGESE